MPLPLFLGLVRSAASLPALLCSLAVAARRHLVFSATILAAGSHGFLILHAGFSILAAARRAVLSGTAGSHLLGIAFAVAHARHVAVF